MSSSESDFKFEKFEEYYGPIDHVKKQINECKVCHSKLIISHMPDYKNLIVQEGELRIDNGNIFRVNGHLSIVNNGQMVAANASTIIELLGDFRSDIQPTGRS